jgi:hypothetical protein
LLEWCWGMDFQAQSVDRILLLPCLGPWSQWGHSDLEFAPWHPLLSPLGIRMFGPSSAAAHRWGTKVLYRINTYKLSWPLCWLPTQCRRKSCGRFFDWSCTRLLVRLDHLV